MAIEIKKINSDEEAKNLIKESSYDILLREYKDSDEEYSKETRTFCLALVLSNELAQKIEESQHGWTSLSPYVVSDKKIPLFLVERSINDIVASLTEDFINVEFEE